MARKGITFVSESEPGFWPDVVAEAINLVGMRGLIDTYGEITTFNCRKDGNVQYGTHLLEEEDITDEALQTCVDNKRNHNCLFLTHCMENDWRKELIYTKYNRSSLQLYKEKELLDKRTILFHAVYVNPADIDLIAEAGASIVHCPVANLWSGAGIAPISLMLDKGVNVCLGTDYASTDIWEVMRMAYYLLKYNVPVNRFKAEDILKMSTCNGAEAYHQDSLGTIGNGMSADLVFIRKNDLVPNVHSHDFTTFAHNLLFQTKETDIQHVMVGGDWVMYDRKMTKVDEEEINTNYKSVLNKIYASLS
jgi:5-methylthioadenosine/S-adenosylhomocysteine deaminase